MKIFFEHILATVHSRWISETLLEQSSIPANINLQNKETLILE